MKNITHKLAAALTVGATTLIGADSAFAQATNLKTVTDNITTSASGLPGVISAGSYIGGSALALFGVLKLKAHADAPQQVKMTDGLSRLAAGGGLLTLPFMAEAMQGTIADGEAGTLNASDTAIDNSFNNYTN